jgi:hypothetical protein
MFRVVAPAIILEPARHRHSMKDPSDAPPTPAAGEDGGAHAVGCSAGSVVVVPPWARKKNVSKVNKWRDQIRIRGQVHGHTPVEVLCESHRNGISTLWTNHEWTFVAIAKQKGTSRKKFHDHRLNYEMYELLYRKIHENYELFARTTNYSRKLQIIYGNYESFTTTTNNSRELRIVHGSSGARAENQLTK